MKKSVNIAGFWFHITFDGNTGIDQKGNTWENPKNPRCLDEKLINACLDGFNNINDLAQIEKAQANI